MCHTLAVSGKYTHYSVSTLSNSSDCAYICYLFKLGVDCFRVSNERLSGSGQPLVNGKCLTNVAFTVCLLCSCSAFSDTRITVLDFELHDLTLLPGTAEELQRTASVAPLLREALVNKGGYELVAIPLATQTEANAAFGYLYEHPRVAAALGRRAEVDWIAIGRIHKPSFLFAYLKVRLVNVETEQLAGDYVVEVNGQMRKLTVKGAANIAGQINKTIYP